ncbi:MAG: shikimate kinase [Chlamydiota bacterium]|jgi:shikimate kinase
MGNNIILIGFKKSGKSTLGPSLAQMMKYQFIDIDRLIERTFDPELTLSYFEIYEKYGEEFFRKIERKVIHSIEGISNTVIATGGGSVLDQKNLRVLKRLGKMIYLYLPEELLKKRIETGRIPPFLLSDFESTFRARNSIYRSVADFTIDLKENTQERAKEQVMQFFKNGK